tara:strand:+ start:737 stop:1513 length:777 start_codon:yes stop_codon:yes gene_type:complete
MITKIARPTDDYSPDWAAYWAQNPHLMRSVGADAAGDGGGDDEQGGGDNGGDKDFDPSNYVPKADVEKMQAELDRMKAKHAEAEKHRKEQEAAARKAAEEAAKKSGDVEALEKSWAEKFTTREAELSEQVNTFQSMIHTLTVGSTATTLAAKIAMEGCAEGLTPHIQSRLKMEMVDGEPKVKVLGKDGRPSAMSLEDLEKELKATPYLAPIIKGSSASGAGGIGRGGGAGKGEISRADFDALPPSKQHKMIKDGVKVV